MVYMYTVTICGVMGCNAGKSEQIYENFLKEIKKYNLEDDVNVVKTGCFGLCEEGPILRISPDYIYYTRVQPQDVEEIVLEHFVKGNPVERLIYKDPKKIDGEDRDISFYSKQERVVLKNCGIINADDIDEYVGSDGYIGLENALFKMTPEQVIDEIKKSGLRGRGGAGFPTWRKWTFTRNSPGDKKYIICNADEGDPGAFMDRSIIEGDPHSVIEGMIIAAYAIGASMGYVYIRIEYGFAIQRIKKAIEKAYEYGFLGENILGSGFSFELDVRMGAGAFVCGEETALIASIEGKRGTPVPRPPYPSVKGLFGCPTSINNVETWVNVTRILANGADWYSKIGTEGSKGTKVFCLTGKVENSSIVEVPMGMSLREIIFDLGGGIKDGKKIKALQTGGPSGGVIPEHLLDTPVDYERLKDLGSMMGSGGMIVIDEDDCVIDIAKFYLDFCVEESCGRCAPCRIGGFQMLNLLDKISKGKAELEDLTRLKRIALAMKKASLCGLGQSAANPVISTLNYFEHEYIEHITEKKCRAKKCKDLISYVIIDDKCRKCALCAKECPVNAIPGDREKGFVIDQEKCIKCGLCISACPFDAVVGE